MIDRYRAVFVSDFHLGSAGCRVGDICNFLQSFESDYLYLVGDIVDGWVGSSEAKWTQGCTDVVHAILGKSNDGGRVMYTPGNHDSFLRRFNGSELGNLAIDHSFIHPTSNGQDMLVVHGDLFDRSCTRFRHAAWAGAWMYEYITILNVHVNKRRRRRERRPVDFSASVKLWCKRYTKRSGSFEAHLLSHAAENGCAGVICGHIHRPQVLQTDRGTYFNTGDWVEHRTALVEHYDGRFELIDWGEFADRASAERLAVGAN